MTIRIHPPYTPAVIDEQNLTGAVEEIIDLGSLPIRLSVNPIVANSAENVGAFIDGVLASGTVTITSFAAAHLTAASLVSQGVTYTAQILGAVGNSYTVEVIDSTSGGLSYTENAGAITIDLGGDTPDVDTVVALFTGTPSAFVDVTGSGATAVVVHAVQSLAGGIDAAVVTVAGHDLVESTDWDSITNNNTAADNLAAAIDALSEVTAANPAAAIITVKAATIGTAGNAITTTKTGSGVTVQQAHLTGGLDSAVDGEAFTITIPDHGFSTGLKVNYDVLAGTTIDNLVNNTDYFVEKIDDDTIQLSATDGGDPIEVANANDAVGGGSFTLTPTALDVDVTVSTSNDGENFVEQDSDNFSTAGATLYEYPSISTRYLKIEVEPNDSETDVRVVIHSKL